MHLVSSAQTPAAMRDEIANYLAAQAENFAGRKATTNRKIQQDQLESIRNALMVIAKMIKGIVIEPGEPYFQPTDPRRCEDCPHENHAGDCAHCEPGSMCHPFPVGSTRKGWRKLQQSLVCPYCGREYLDTSEEPVSDILEQLLDTGKCFEDCPGKHV